MVKHQKVPKYENNCSLMTIQNGELILHIQVCLDVCKKVRIKMAVFISTMSSFSKISKLKLVSGLHIPCSVVKKLFLP